MFKKILLPAAFFALGAYSAKMHCSKIPLIGDTAPSFRADSTQGKINFPEDFKGSWTIFFSHPADFTPVCTTEIMTFQSMAYEFRQLNTKLLGLSVDSINAHMAWLKEIKDKIKYNGLENIEVTYPVIDDKKMEIAKLYQMIHPATSNAKSIRAVYIIDPQSIIRTILFYPASNGRNLHEIRRLLISLQTSDMFDVTTPANWEPGDDAIIPPPESWDEAIARVEKKQKDAKCYDWFLCFRQLSIDEIREKLFNK